MHCKEVKEKIYIIAPLHQKHRNNFYNSENYKRCQTCQANNWIKEYYYIRQTVCTTGCQSVNITALCSHLTPHSTVVLTFQPGIKDEIKPTFTAFVLN